MTAILIGLTAWMSGQEMNSPIDQNPIGRQAHAYVENRGQITDQHGTPRPDVRFLLAGKGLNVQLRRTGFSYDSYISRVSDVAEDRRIHRIDVAFIGGSPEPSIIGLEPSADYTNYYTHGLPEEGATFVRSFSRVRYESIYPNIDVEFFLDDDGLPEYQFVVHPGGDANVIRIRYEGADAITASASELILHVAHGTITERIPRSYEAQSGRELIVSYKTFADNEFGFSVPTYSRAQGVIIDPAPRVSWGTYYGGVDTDILYDVKSDNIGDIIACGRSNSATSVATQGSYQSTIKGSYDAFFVKFNKSGVRQWSTYFGGTSGDTARSLAIQSTNYFVVVGTTSSTTGIATVTGGHQTTLGGKCDAFITRFKPDGTRSWGTYYGGSGDDYGNDVAIDQDDRAIVVGNTDSRSGIATANAHKPALTKDKDWNTYISDAFFAVITHVGTRVLGSYFGDIYLETATSVATYPDGRFAFTGKTGSPALAATDGAYDVTYNGYYDAYIARFSSTGARQWVTYYGGTEEDEGRDIAIDASRNVVVVGRTASSTGIASNGSHASTIRGGADGFIVKFNWDRERVWASYIGGDGPSILGDADAVNGVAVDENENIVLTGTTNSSNGISSTSPGTTVFQPTLGGLDDAYIMKFDRDGKRTWGSYLGGTLDDYGHSIATIGADSFVMVGSTQSTSAISTNTAHQKNNGGGTDGFLVVVTDGCILPTPKITGPASACEGSTQRYSAEEKSGITRVWSSTATATLLRSSSSRDMDVRWNKAGVDTLRLRETITATGCAKDTLLIVTVNAAPTPVITGSSSPCVGTEQSYSTSRRTGRQYQWSFVARWGSRGSFVGSTTESAAVVRWTSSGQTELALRETITSTGCQKDTVFSVNVRPLPSPVIDGPSSVCIGDSPAYTVALVPDHTYQWSQVTRGTLQATPQPNIVSISWMSSGTDTVKVRERNTSTGCVADASLIVAVNSVSPPMITGATYPCANAVYPYSVSYTSGHTYAWTVVENGAIVGESNLNTVSVRWTTWGSGQLRLVETDARTYCTFTANLMVVISDTIRPQIKAENNGRICAGSSITLQTDGLFDSYTWYLGADYAGNSPMLDVSTPGTYRVRVTSGPCSGTSDPVTITLTPQPTASIRELPVGTLIVVTDAAAPRFQWLRYIDGWTPITGETRASMQPNESGLYAAQVTDVQTGCLQRSDEFTFTKVIAGVNDDEAISVTQGIVLTATPNPAHDQVLIAFHAREGTGNLTRDGVQLSIVDMNGRSVLSLNSTDSPGLSTGSIAIPTHSLSSGLFIVHLRIGMHNAAMMISIMP